MLGFTVRGIKQEIRAPVRTVTKLSPYCAELAPKSSPKRPGNQVRFAWNNTRLMVVSFYAMRTGNRQKKAFYGQLLAHNDRFLVYAPVEEKRRPRFGGLVSGRHSLETLRSRAVKRGGEKAMFVKTLKAIVALLFAVPFQANQGIGRIAGGGGFGDEDADFCKKGR